MLFRFEYAAVLSIGVLFIILFGVFYVNDTLAEQVLTLALASSSSTLPMPRDIFISTMFLVGEFFVTIIALVTLPQLIVRDEQQKPLPLFLSRPIPRWNYYFGKYIASTATLSASMCFLAALISVFVFIQSPSLLPVVAVSTFFWFSKLPFCLNGRELSLYSCTTSEAILTFCFLNGDRLMRGPGVI